MANKLVVQVRLNQEIVSWLDQQCGEVESRSSLVRRLLDGLMRQERSAAAERQ